MARKGASGLNSPRARYDISLLCGQVAPVHSWLGYFFWLVAPGLWWRLGWVVRQGHCQHWEE